MNATEKSNYLHRSRRDQGYLDLQQVIGHIDEHFIMSLDAMVSEMRKFRASEEVDSKFLR